jgi:hypothetical protein
MPGDQPIAEGGEPKVDAWVANENADLAVQISPELILFLPALLTLRGDLISSHLGGNKGN